jgi:type IV secretory pathway TrbL component
MNMSSQGFLDDFAKMILAHCSTAVDNLLPYVLGLMSVMLMWNIITNWDLYWGKQDYSKLIPLLVTATFFVALSYSWGFVLDTVYQFGSEVAITASNNKGTIDDNKFLTTITPSMIVNEGVDNAITVFNGHVLGISPSEVEKDGNQEDDNTQKIVKIMKAGISGNVMSGLIYAFITLLLFGFVAVSYLYTVLEFFIIGSLSMVLLPFGLLDRTKAIVDKILNYFFVSAIRIAIFLFLILLINPTIKNAFKNATFTESVLGIDTLSAMISLFALAFLAFKTPSFAAALFNGAINSPPSLTGIGVQAVQTAIMLKTLGASKAAAATKEGGKKVVEEGVENSVKTGSQAGTAAIDTSRKDVMADSSTSSSNKGDTTNKKGTTQTTDTSTSDTTSQEDTTSSNTDRTKKDTVSDSGSMTDTSSKDYDVDTSTESTTEANTDSPRQLVDNYYDTSNGSAKDDYASSSMRSSNNGSNDGSRINDMIQSESQSMAQQDSSRSVQKTTDHVKSTIQEFKIHELKSQEEKE